MMNAVDINDALKSGQAQVIITEAISMGRERRNTQGAEFNELEYFCGVMACMKGLDLWDYVPPFWPLSLQSGNTLIPYEQGEHVITDSDRLKYHERMVNHIREANSWGQAYEVLCGALISPTQYLLIVATGYGDCYGGIIGSNRAGKLDGARVNRNGCESFPDEETARDWLDGQGWEIIEPEDL